MPQGNNLGLDWLCELPTVETARSRSAHALPYKQYKLAHGNLQTSYYNRHVERITELAASELLARVRDFVDELLDGRVPRELRTALPDDLSAEQRAHLDAAATAIDEITCSTRKASRARSLLSTWRQRWSLPRPISLRPRSSAFWHLPHPSPISSV
ncbi:hypothetical protein [Sphingomonas sp. NFX23]|uniref:hypothetical protein n=1 Tax=Sphingomonas sp. NFX23 TaxID=2819532 RepID=UPI003CFB25F7